MSLHDSANKFQFGSIEQRNQNMVNLSFLIYSTQLSTQTEVPIIIVLKGARVSYSLSASHNRRHIPDEVKCDLGYTSIL